MVLKKGYEMGSGWFKKGLVRRVENGENNYSNDFLSLSSGFLLFVAAVSSTIFLKVCGRLKPLVMFFAYFIFEFTIGLRKYVNSRR